MEHISNMRIPKSAIKSPVIKLINCELGKNGAGCLTNFNEAVRAADARFTTITTATTITPTADDSDYYAATALGAAATIAAPSGTPSAGQRLVIRLKDDGTGRALTWNAIYRAIGVTLPTTTVAGKTHYIFFIYNATDTKRDAVQVNAQA